MTVLKGEQIMIEAAPSQNGAIEVAPVTLIKEMFQLLFIEPTDVPQNKKANEPPPD
jgi:hypothetical protein